MAPAVPRPGLAIRIIGDVTEERLEILRDADAILQEEVRRAGLYREIWQSFAVLPAIRSVGVQGDERTYGYPIVIRAVTSEDAMTADWARLPYHLIETMSGRIVNEIPGVNRVVLRCHLQASGHHRVGEGGSGDFVGRLAAARIGATHNQYAASELRQLRLRRYLESRALAPLILVGEAAGYRGARVSGIPFTSERQLTGSGPAEASATIVHRVCSRRSASRQTSCSGTPCRRIPGPRRRTAARHAPRSPLHGRSSRS